MSSSVDGFHAEDACFTCFAGENGDNHSTEDNRTCPHCRGFGPSLSSSSSCSLLSFDSVAVNDTEKVWRIITAAAKGFAIGAGLKGGLAIFSLLARLRRRKSSAPTRFGIFFMLFHFIKEDCYCCLIPKAGEVPSLSNW